MSNLNPDTLKDRINQVLDNMPTNQTDEGSEVDVQRDVELDITPEEVEAAEKAVIEKAAVERELKATGSEPKDTFEPPQAMRSILRDTLSKRIADIGTVDKIMSSFSEEHLNKMEAVHLTSEGRQLQADIFTQVILDNRNKDAEMPAINTATRDHILMPKLGSLGVEEAKKDLYSVLNTLGDGFTEAFERMPAEVQARTMLHRYQERLKGNVVASPMTPPPSQAELERKRARYAVVEKMATHCGMPADELLAIRKSIGLSD